MQRRLEQLPEALWAQVLQKLSVRELLRTRLVSRSFVRLSQLLELELDWFITTRTKASSLSLFVKRHCTESTSPKLFIELAPCGDFLSHGIAVASLCSNLRQLSCLHTEVQLPEAQALLRLMPTALTSLRLLAPAALADDPAWDRLTSLSLVVLTISRPCLSAYSARGLASISSLQHLALDIQNGYDEDVKANLVSMAPIDAATFVQSSITRLEINAHLFRGRLDLAQLPRLKTVCVFDREYSPSWLKDQRLETLEVWNHDQLQACEPARLLCNCLKGQCGEQEPAYQLSYLLSMPRLARFELQPWNEAPSAYASLAGSCQDHKTFLDKTEVRFSVPVRLCLGSWINEEDNNIDLRRNGHAVICFCPACLRA